MQVLACSCGSRCGRPLSRRRTATCRRARRTSRLRRSVAARAGSKIVDRGAGLVDDEVRQAAAAVGVQRVAEQAAQFDVWSWSLFQVPRYGVDVVGARAGGLRAHRAVGERMRRCSAWVRVAISARGGNVALRMVVAHRAALRRRCASTIAGLGAGGESTGADADGGGVVAGACADRRGKLGSGWPSAERLDAVRADDDQRRARRSVRCTCRWWATGRARCRHSSASVIASSAYSTGLWRIVAGQQARSGRRFRPAPRRWRRALPLLLTTGEPGLPNTSALLGCDPRCR